MYIQRQDINDLLVQVPDAKLMNDSKTQQKIVNFVSCSENKIENKVDTLIERNQ